MKRKIIFSFLLLSWLFSSCLIKSFNPFFHKEDVVFDDRLTGKWLDQDASSWSFEKFKVDKGVMEKKDFHPHYILEYREDEGSISRFYATLFKLDDELYLDFFPDLELITDHELLAVHTLPVHSLAKIKFSTDGTVDIKWFNEEWLGELIQEHKAKIKHEKIYYDSEDATVVLTASTDELQQFIRIYGDDPNAFDCDDQFAGDTFCKKLTKH